MITILWIVGIILTLFALVEIGCRIYHLHRYGIPFHSKVVGEYPYSRFVEQVDPPLYYRFVKGFRSPMVNINRFRCRGKEPTADGTKKRLMVIGESNFFGAKLRKEKDLWSYRLERLLKMHGYTNWEVLNAGNPMYNTVQHRTLWEQELREAKPDILLISPAGNEVTQTWMMGSQWKPGVPWPWKFIMALERKSPWWNKILARFCFYFLLRRRMTSRPGFTPQDDTFKWEECLHSLHESYRSILKDALKNGARIAIVNHGFAVDLAIRPENRKKLDAIQSNWEEHTKGNMLYILRSIEYVKDTLCRELDIPFIDLLEAFQEYPRRFECYFDIAHWNERGMNLVAKTLFRELMRLGWLDSPVG